VCAVPVSPQVRIPPHDLDAETSVLGALLMDPAAITRILDQLNPDDFYRENNGQIYRAAQNLFREGEPIDNVTLAAELGKLGVLERVGGRAHLALLQESVPTAANVEHYARIVKDRAYKRRLISAGTQVTTLGYDESMDAEEAVNAAQAHVYAISDEKVGSGMEHIYGLLKPAMDRIDAQMASGGGVIGIPSGFHDLDRMTNGFKAADLAIIAGRPSMGKTSFVLNVTLYAAVEQKKPVAIFSLEMSKEQLVERMLCEQARIDAQRLHRGTLSDVEYERLAGALGPLGDAPIFIDDSPTLDDLTLRLKSRQARSREGVELIVLDYLQLMQGRSRNGDSNRVQEVSAISRALKGIARELKIPVIAISQLSRAPEARPDKRPILSDLRESGCLTGDTRVFLPDLGTYRPIAELVGATGFRVLALDTDRWELEPRRVTSSFSTGVKPVFRLTTRLGRTVRATGNHKFLGIDGWKRLDQFGPGERVAIPRWVPSPKEPSISEAELSVADAVGSTALRTLAIGDVYWDDIVSVEPDGEEEVYDLTVDGLHNFVADDMVLHNSIEQDADIVMFLYRDDYYNREKSEKPGIAEIIVAKHRNGPTGVIELMFRRELTRFENLERRRPEPVGPD
jgi:replicative DNA helicase